MGRFSVLKSNSFTKEKPIVKMKEEKPIVKMKEVESEWLKRIKMRCVKEKERININDPNNWKGPYWKGPIFIKSNNILQKGVTYLKRANECNASTYIIPHRKIEYSKNDIDWYDSWENTFTSDQLQAIERYKEEENMDEFCKRVNDLYERRREESEKHYDETGEYDDFAWAALQGEQYDEYCRKLDEEYQEQQTEIEEEYLVDDENDDYY